MSDNKGIYKINASNGEIYIGSGIDLKKRKQQHFNCLKRGVHVNKILQHYYNKYGEASLVFEVIEIVEHKSDLITREQFYIDTLKPKFNICKKAYSRMGQPSGMKGRKMTQEHKDKIVLARKGIWKMSEETKQKIREKSLGRVSAFKGKKHTQENKDLFSKQKQGKVLTDEEKAKFNFKGGKHSEEHKKYMSEKLKGRPFTEEHKLALRKPKTKKENVG